MQSSTLGFRKTLGLVCASALVATSAFAVELLADLNVSTRQGHWYSHSSGVDLPDGTLLQLDDYDHGPELWFTDGISVAGTRLVRDICPGGTGSGPTHFVAIKDFALFHANDCTHGRELWRSDGSAAGTYMVADIGPGVANSGSVPEPAVINDTLIFAADDGYSGPELWRSDGTAAGTYRLADITPGSNGSGPGGFTASTTHVFFSTSLETWVTDGTIAGTRVVASISGRGFTPIGDAMFFTADTIHGRELWRASADGSDVQMVANINTEPTAGGNDAGSYPTNLFELGGAVIFSAEVTTSGLQTYKLFRAEVTGSGVTELATLPATGSSEYLVRLGDRALFGVKTEEGSNSTTIWMTDGTPANTRPLDLDGLEFSTAFGVAYGNAEAYFFGRQPDGDGRDRVWRTDGTRAGTRLLTNAVSNTRNANIAYFNGRVYFEAGYDSDPAGDELWSSDGTEAGTFLVRNIKFGDGDSNITALRNARGRLQFFAETGGVLQLWTSDGTEAGTVKLVPDAEGTSTNDSDIVFGTRLGNRVLFSARSEAYGNELWASDGTAQGTVMVKDISPGITDSLPSSFVSLGDVVLFTADDWDHDVELWRSDGTEAGTFRLTEINDDSYESSEIRFPGAAAVMNGVAYFTAWNGSSGRALWRSDGSVSGTYKLSNPSNYPAVHILGTTGSRLLIGVYAAVSEPEIWSTDGTAASEVRVASGLTFITGGGVPAFNGRACFRAWDVSPQRVEVWCSNGSVGDLVRATDLASLNLSAQDVRVFGDQLLVNAAAEGESGGLFASLGTDTSMQQLSSQQIAYAEGLGNRLVFLSESGSLMVTDGTAAGTRDMLQGVSLGGGSFYGPFGVFGNSVVLTVLDPQLGPVLWRTDGTNSGTRYLADVDPGTAPSNRSSGQFFQLGQHLLFSALRSGIGHELFSLSATDPNATDDSASMEFGAAAIIDVLANDADFDGMLNSASVTIVTSPVHGTATVNPADGTVTYQPNAAFSGSDELTYRVSDDEGRTSNVATVRLTVAASSGGTPSVPPPSSPPPSSPPKTGGGGGGGSTSVCLLILLLMMRALSDMARTGGPSRRQASSLAG